VECLQKIGAIKMNTPFVETNPLNTALAAASRSREIPETLDAYGWLVGSWELDVLHYWAIDVSARGIKGEVHAGWVLEGRAVQDVWIMPRRSDRSAQLDKQLNMHGTTLRVWDATIQAWRITWRNRAGELVLVELGSRRVMLVVLIGFFAFGSGRWFRFFVISAELFHWVRVMIGQDRYRWPLEGEFRAKRTA
jgi:hypothetical protein